MNRIEIPSDARGHVLVFALDLPQGEVAEFARASAGGWPLKAALGAEVLEPGRVEVFPVADLDAFGLPGYLTEGHGITETTLTEDRQALEAVTGTVAVITGAAFGGKAQVLEPKPPLRLIGYYREQLPEVRMEPLPAGGARGSVAGGRPGAAPRGLGRGLILTVIALAALALIVLMITRDGA